jgi:hypothetical protein
MPRARPLHAQRPGLARKPPVFRRRSRHNVKLFRCNPYGVFAVDLAKAEPGPAVVEALAREPALDVGGPDVEAFGMISEKPLRLGRGP